MHQIPLRKKHIHALPRPRASIRPVVHSCETTTLQIDDGAFQVLSMISGKQMPPSIRKVLLPSLDEHLRDKPTGPEYAGPFGLADVYGAMLGVAQFALQNEGSWLFVRIPEGQTTTADVYAVPSTGRPWFLELKAVAPLSSEIPPSRPKDICENVAAQLRKGRRQVEKGLVLPPLGAPAVEVYGPQAVTSSTGGEALSVVIMRRAG